MTKPKKAATSGDDKKAMDAVLRRMLATPPQPTAIKVKAPKGHSKGASV